jgi:hypothetical protein
LANYLKLENLIILDQKKKKMSKKKTNNLTVIKLLPQNKLKNISKLIKIDEKLRLAHLVFLDMLTLIKM